MSAALVEGVRNGELDFNADGSFDYVPGADYNGPDSFTYRASDGASSDGTADGSVARVVISVNPMDEAEPPNPNACTEKGTNGKDVLKGTPGRDVLCGYGGKDTIRGMGGNDLIKGGFGNDTVQGNDGRDRLYGGSGDDVSYREAVADLLRGGTGQDNTTQQ